MRVFFLLALLTTSLLGADRPNIVFILCDDLGYGDVHANHPQCRIATPAFDRLAAEGLRFTDAHTTSSVCTPTRYGLITGRYNWRSRLQAGVLGGLSPRLIEPGRMTVASLLKAHGYHTAVIGKWHLGMDWVRQPGKDVEVLGIEKPEQVTNVDYDQRITNGPTSVGFDHYFGISASLDMVPYTFIEDDHVVASPTEMRAFPFFLGDDSKVTRLGPAAPGFAVDEVLPTLTKRATAYIDGRAAEAREGKPFFLYLPLNAPHTPIAPSPEWRGKSGLNAYADFVMETDWAVAQVLAALDRNGLTRDTLIVATSDNGCSPQARIDELAAKGHAVNGPLRGTKADIWDGGHRVPFLIRWPATVKANTTSHQLVSLVDFMATVAEIVGAQLPDDAAEDSVSLLPILRGKDAPVRDALVHHSVNGVFAIREGEWKLEFCPGSGGWSDPRDPQAKRQGLPDVQLYRFTPDEVSEQRNVAAEHPDIVERLTERLEKIIADGRSTPGQPQANAVPVVMRKPVAGGKK